MSRRDETWLPVVGFPFYEVSDQGNVRSVDRTVVSRSGHMAGVARRLKGKALSPATNSRYRWVSLYREQVKYDLNINRLVLDAFIGAAPDLVCRHLNGDSYDDRLENLAWGTISENAYDCVAHGTHTNASKTHCPKGHPYDEDNTIYESRGSRACRICKRNCGRAYARQRRLEASNV